MKRAFLAILVIGMTPSVYADQTTCLRSGDLVTCTSPPPQADWVSLIQQNNANTSPEADARAALLRQQAELVRLQQELLRQQIAAAKAAAGK